MFSISKNHQESMVEVLAKVEKYINGEEALICKRRSSSTHKEKAGLISNGNKALGDKETERDPQEGIENDP